MHVDAFFEYLLGNPHPYWTEIPLNPNPVSDGGRDGVAAEDDMALRSLLPHIRPRRGRKRPDDDSDSRSPSQKPRMVLGSDQNNPNVTGPGVDQQQLDLWAGAQPDARSSTYLFAQDQFTRMNMNLATPGPWTGDSFAQTPMTANPYSAVTPATAGAYWSNQPGEAKSSLSPMRLKTNRRHGAKVVSSAWRSGGPGGSGKTRGRPPLNRQASQSQSQSQGEAAGAGASSFSAFPAVQSASPPSAFKHPSLHPSPQMIDTTLQQHPMMTLGISNSAAPMTPAPNSQSRMGSMQQGYDVTGQATAETQSRDLRQTRSQLSLQVPERTGAEVRLATPPGQQVPSLVMNGTVTTAGDQASIMAHHQHHQSMNASMAGSDIHMMNPFALGAAQSMYSMQYHEQQQPPPLPPPDPPRIQHMPQASVDTASLYSTATTSTHHTTATDQGPMPARLAESASADTARRPASNRTNLEALEALLTCELLGAEWVDAQGGRIATCGVDEAGAVAQEVLERVRREAGSAQGLLMNIAAIAGVMTCLKADGRARVQRMGVVEGGREVYDVYWELQLGNLRSGFSLREVVARDGWVRRNGEEQRRDDAEGDDGDDGDDGADDEEGEEHAEMWRKRYHGLLGVVQEQTAELSEFRQGMIDLCRPRSARRKGEGGESAG